MPRSSSIAVILRELRTARGLTQDDVASALGVVRQTYSHYESGRRTPRYDVLFKISELYQISLDELMELSEAASSDNEDAAAADTPRMRADSELSAMLSYFNLPRNKKRFRDFSDKEKELLYYFSRMPEGDKKELIEIAKIKYRRHKAPEHGEQM